MATQICSYANMQKTAAGRQDADKSCHKWHTGNCHLTGDKNHWRRRRITSRENGVTSDSDSSWTKLWLIPLSQSAADKAYTRETESLRPPVCGNSPKDYVTQASLSQGELSRAINGRKGSVCCWWPLVAINYRVAGARGISLS